VHVAESHQEGGARASLPSAEVSDETGNHERYRHKGNSHSSKGVEVGTSSTIRFLGSDNLAVGVFVGVPTFFDVDGPEAPEHSSEGDKGSEGGVEDHVGLPFVTHVASGCDLDNHEDIPAEEVDVTVSKEHREGGFHVGLDQVELLLECNDLLVKLS
jgi:hypothetical protein